MEDLEHNASHHHTGAEERYIREAALDKTIEAWLPASDPPSTNPNPDTHDALEGSMPADGDADYEQ